MSILDKKKLIAIIKQVKYIDTPLGKIELDQIIGEGGTSIVKKAHIEDVSRELAIKFLSENIADKPSSQYKRFKQAYVNLFFVQYSLPVLPQLYFGELQVNDVIIPYTIMPYVPKTLKKYRKEYENNYNLHKFEFIFNCLLSNIEKIHQHNIIE